jgi:hypothetical protein
MPPTSPDPAITNPDQYHSATTETPTHSQGWNTALYQLDAGVDLRDVQIAARHADPRTTTRYDRARQNLDRHPNYILAAYMASGT